MYWNVHYSNALKGALTWHYNGIKLVWVDHVPDRRMWAQQASSTRWWKIQRYCECMPLILIVPMLSVLCKKIVNVCLPSYNTVSYIVLAVMCICVIYKYLSWGKNQQQDLGKPSLNITKPSHQWEVVGHPISCGEWKGSVCFERGARMDSFAVVLTTLSCSSMY
jgi:hypothetical protein